MPIITYYHILGVKDDATVDEIAAAYRKKIKQWHPDVCRHPEAEEKMKELNKAAELLLDPVRRKDYDTFLAHELSLFRKATSWGRKDQPENAHLHSPAHDASSSEYVRKRRPAAHKSPWITQRTIRFAAGFCAAGFVLLVLVFAGLIAITTPDVPRGVSPHSPVPAPVVSAISSGRAEPSLDEGDDLFTAGDYEGALRLYDAVIAKNPDLALKEVWYNRGIAQNVLGHYRDASQSFDRALALSPGDSLALAQKGAALKGLGRYEEALDYTDRALAGYSDEAWIWNNRAIALTSPGQQKESRAASDNARFFTSGMSGY
jgi:tetratricopeptide (TPR) repeat protein